MVAENREDVFVRHRGAVLDTLLADPGLSGLHAPAYPDTGGLLVAEHETSQPQFTGDPVSPSVPSGPAARRSAAAGPKASERILALLNGEAAPPGPGLEFESDYSTVATKLAAPQEPSGPPPSPPRPAPTRSAGPLPELLAQLKKPKVALSVAAVLAVVLIVVLVTTSGGKTDNSSQLAVITPVSAAPTQPASVSPTAPPDATIQVRSAQSHCPPGGTPGMDAFGGGGSGKAWSCARAFNVDVQVLTISLGKPYAVESIGIVPGWDHVGPDGTDEWTKYRTVSRVSYRFDNPDATTYVQQTMDQRTLVVSRFDPPVQASKIVLTVLASNGDPSINTTAISSIVITGH
jgi:hypothetical protein